MKTFQNFLECKIWLEQDEAPPPPADAGGAPPDMGMPPMGAPDLGGGLGAPPMGGGFGGPPMGGPSLSPGLDSGMGQPGSAPTAKKLKAYNVWNVLQKILESK